MEVSGFHESLSRVNAFEVGPILERMRYDEPEGSDGENVCFILNL